MSCRDRLSSCRRHRPTTAEYQELATAAVLYNLRSPICTDLKLTGKILQDAAALYLIVTKATAATADDGNGVSKDSSENSDKITSSRPLRIPGPPLGASNNLVHIHLAFMQSLRCGPCHTTRLAGTCYKLPHHAFLFDAWVSIPVLIFFRMNLLCLEQQGLDMLQWLSSHHPQQQRKHQLSRLGLIVLVSNLHRQQSD
jgi:hypothetical protein